MSMTVRFDVEGDDQEQLLEAALVELRDNWLKVTDAMPFERVSGTDGTYVHKQGGTWELELNVYRHSRTRVPGGNLTRWKATANFKLVADPLNAAGGGVW